MGYMSEFSDLQVLKLISFYLNALQDPHKPRSFEESKNLGLSAVGALNVNLGLNLEFIQNTANSDVAIIVENIPKYRICLDSATLFWVVQKHIGWENA